MKLSKFSQKITSNLWDSCTFPQLKSISNYIHSNEIYLNTLGDRFKALKTPRDFLPWTFIGRRCEKNPIGLSGLIAINKYGYCAILSSAPQTFGEELKIFIYQLNNKIQNIKTLMGPSLLTNELIPHIPQKQSCRVDYEMLARKKGSLMEPIRSFTTRDFTLYKTQATDIHRIIPLQNSYEIEEVLVPGHRLNLQHTFDHLEYNLKNQLAVHGEYRGRIISKAMTNARGVVYDQIGGVYTVPELRNRGFGRLTMEYLLEEIDAQGKNQNLFVKQQNQPAISLYKKLNFETVGPFSIIYFD